MLRLNIKVNVNEEPEVSWQNGKLTVKAEIYWRGETSAFDRKGEVNLNYEYRVVALPVRLLRLEVRNPCTFNQNAGARNILNVRALVLRSPALNTLRDTVICLKADSTYQSAAADPIDISGYLQPPTAQGSIEYVMGEASSASQVRVFASSLCVSL